MQAIRANGVQNFSHNDKTGLQDPRNLIAMNMVRCMNCNKYYPLDEIHLHLRIHQAERGFNYQQSRVPSGGLDAGALPHSNVRPPSSDQNKLDQLSDTASTVSRNRFNPIDVQTMAPSELPEPDRLRRAIPKPQPSSLINQDRSVSIQQPIGFPGSRQVGTNSESRPSTSDLSSELDAPRFVNEVIRLPEDYYEKVSISRTRVDISAKNINIYSNQNHVAVDNHIDRPKENNLKSPIKGPHWEATVVKEPDSTISKEKDGGSKPHKEEPSKKTFVIEDNQRLEANNQPIHINTRGPGKPFKPNKMVDSRLVLPPNSNSRGPSSCSWLKCGDASDVEPEIAVEPDGRYNYTCTGCGGFYCPVCKSTIPPQFRPPPGIKEYLAHSRATHISHGGTPARE